jgi:hypothetical protein
MKLIFNCNFLLLLLRCTMHSDELIALLGGSVVSDEFPLYTDNMTAIERADAHKNLINLFMDIYINYFMDIPPNLSDLLVYRVTVGYKVNKPMEDILGKYVGEIISILVHCRPRA